MVLGANRMTKEIGYNPTRFRQMVDEHGGVGAAKILIGRKDASDGFTVLWENHRLELSCEAFALLPWYSELFTESEREQARRRLTEYRFDVDDFVRVAVASPPAWFKSDSNQ